MDLFAITQTTAIDHHRWLDSVWSRTGLNGIISTTIDRVLYNAHTILLGMCLRNETIHTVPQRVHGDMSEWTAVSTTPGIETLPTGTDGDLLEYIDCSGYKHVGRYTQLSHANLGDKVLPVFKRHITEQVTVAGLVAYYRIASQAVIDQYTLEVGEALAAKVASADSFRAETADRTPSTQDGVLTPDLEGKTITIDINANDPEYINHQVGFLLRDYILTSGIDVAASDIIDDQGVESFSKVLLSAGYILNVNIV